MSTGVVVDFNAQLSRFTSGVDKAINDLNKFENHGKRVSASLKSAFATLGVGLSVAGLGAIIKGSVDAQDRIDKLRQTTGLATETLTGLSFAAKIGGGDLESMAASINKLAVNMGKDAEKFKALGITAKDPLEAFKQLADVFIKVQDPQLRAALGAEALGKSWQGAAPLMMEGSKGIGELIEKGSRLSGITEESAKAAAAFNDKMTELVGTGLLTNKMVGGLLPLLNSLADDLIKSRDASRDLTSEFNPLLETGRAIAVLFGNVAFVFKGVGTEIGGVAAQLAALGRGDFAGARAIGEAMKADAAAARAAFDEWEKKIMGLSGASPGTRGATGKPARDGSVEGAVAGFVGVTGSKPGKTPLQTMLEAQKKRIAEINAMVGDEQMVSVDSVSRQYATKEAADNLQRLNSLLAATPSGELAKAREEMQLLAASLEQGLINEQQFNEAAQAVSKMGEAVKEVDDFARDMGLSFSSAFEDAIVGGKSFSDVLKGLGDDIARIVVRKSVTEPLGNAISGMVKGFDFGKLFGFAGGGYTGDAPRSGGLDGQGGFLAMMHPRETVTDHTKGGGGGGTINNFTVDMRGASVEAVARLERLVVSINGSIERRAMGVMGAARVRGV